MTSHAPSSRHDRCLAIYYEHPEWFTPLFAELDRREIVYDRLLAHNGHFDPADRRPRYALVVNRMSPFGLHARPYQALFYTLHYLAFLKEIGANVLNGYDAYVYEFSKARQLGLLHRLGCGIRVPRDQPPVTGTDRCRRTDLSSDP